jgi:hypothetical protein
VLVDDVHVSRPLLRNAKDGAPTSVTLRFLELENLTITTRVR